MSEAEGSGSRPVRIGSLLVSREMVLIGILVLVALAIRILMMPRDTVINGDGIYYTILGERFVSGDFAGGISAYWSPLYSILTGLSSFLVGNREFAGRLVSLISGALLIVPAFLLIRDIYGRRVAAISGVFIALDPSLIRASGWVMTESLYSLIFVGFLLVGWRALRSDAALLYFSTGLIIGAAYLVKPEAIAYMLPMLTVAIVVGLRRYRLSLRQCGASVLFLSTGFLILLLPYVIFVHSKTGIWTISQKVAINLPAADFDGELLKILKVERTTMKDKIWGDDYGQQDKHTTSSAVAGSASPSDSPGLMMGALILAKKATAQLAWQIRNYLPAMFPIPLLLVAIAGFFCKTWTRRRAIGDAYLALFTFATLIGYSVSAVELRYLYPLVPIIIAWIAGGIVNLSEWCVASTWALREGRSHLRSSMFQVALVILLLAATVPLHLVYSQGNSISNVPFEEKEVGIWLKEQGEASPPTIMSSNITPAFYAEANHLYLPDEELSTIVAYARERQATYVVFSQRRDPAIFDSVVSSVPAGLKEIYKNQDYPSHGIVVYQVEYQ